MKILAVIELNQTDADSADEYLQALHQAGADAGVVSTNVRWTLMDATDVPGLVGEDELVVPMGTVFH